MTRPTSRPRRIQSVGTRGPAVGARFATVVALVLGLVTAAAVGDATLGRAPVVEAAPAEQFIRTAGPLGGITVIGDSVLLGSLLTNPTLAEQLHALGWGPVRMRAGEGYRTGHNSATPASMDVAAWITTWRSQGWDPVDVVVNLGANDSGFCTSTDVACARASIEHLLGAIGPGHRIWWPKITRFYTYSDQQNTWNTALDQVAAERDDVWTWDWPAEMRTGGYSSPDMTHLSADGYRKRSAVMAREITADLAAGSRTGTDAPLPTGVAEPAGFVPLPPDRVLDSREGGAARLAAGSVVELDLSGQVPEGTVAVAVGLTSDGTTEPGFLTAYACGRRRGDVSNVNHAAGVPRGSMGVVPVSDDLRLCVHTRAAGHVIVDIQGAFVPDGGVGFSPVEPSERLLDTRDTGRSSVVEVDAPAGADAVAVNLTATGVSRPGWLKAYPCGGSVPDVSNVNYFPGETVASLAFVPVGDAGTICVRTLAPADIVVDLMGVFGETEPLRFEATAPSRMLDTRSGVGGWSPIHGAGQTFDIRVAPERAEAVIGTITMVFPLRPGWLKAHECGAEPPTSSVNAVAGTVMANATTVGVRSGRVCVTALSAGDTLFDVTGWWVR